MRHAAHHQASAPRPIRRLDAIPPYDNAASREVRSWHPLDQLLQRDIVHFFVIIDQVNDGARQLAHVMRRDVRGHAHGNARSAIEQHIRDTGGQNQRLFKRVIEVRPKIDRVFIQISQQLLGQFLQTSLGVTHRRRCVTIHGTEVALAIHQQVAHRKILCHTSHGFVHCRIAVRVIFTQHLTHDTR